MYFVFIVSSLLDMISYFRVINMIACFADVVVTISGVPLSRP